jgi:hypothetical protein
MCDNSNNKWPALIGFSILDKVDIITRGSDLLKIINYAMMIGKPVTKLITKKFLWGKWKRRIQVSKR